MRNFQCLSILCCAIWAYFLSSCQLCLQLVDGAFLIPNKISETFLPSRVFLPKANKQNKRSPRTRPIYESPSDMDLERRGPTGDRFENDGKDDLGDVQIPSTGVSVNDEMESSERDRFQTELVPVPGMTEVAAQIATTATQRGSFEPLRYLISLSHPTSPASEEKKEHKTTQQRTFVLVDIPPYSPQLVAKMKAFMGSENSHLAAILISNRDAIHYDDAPAVYKLRRTDLEQWKKAFPGLQIIGYRLDIPRDCRESVTEVLDGYGPFALDESALTQQIKTTNSNPNATQLFTEMGKPLTYMEWDHDEAQDILRGRKALEDSNVTVDKEHAPEAIRAREEGKRILAVYTPGHTFGSISYIFPEIGICCSGFTIPVEDTRNEENPGMGDTAPALDCRGYITTSRGGIEKQMESARHLVKVYCDRFNVLLSSRGDPLVLGGDYEENLEALLDIIAQYDKIGRIYEQLGITS